MAHMNRPLLTKSPKNRIAPRQVTSISIVIWIITILTLMFCLNCSETIFESEDDNPIDPYANLMTNPSAEEGYTWRWHFQEPSGILIEKPSNNIFWIEFGRIMQYVHLPDESQGKYVLIIGRSWFTNTIEGSITGRPYIQGFQKNSIDETIYHMQGNLHDGNQDEWKKLYEIAVVQDSVTMIVVILDQGRDSELPGPGMVAKFDDLEVRLFDTLEDAEAYQESWE